MQAKTATLLRAAWAICCAASTLGAVPALAQNGAELPPGSGLSMHGAVGLPHNPTAQLPAIGTVRLQGNFYDLGDSETVGYRDSDFHLYGGYVAGRIRRYPLEISAGYEKLNADRVDHLFTNNADDKGGAFGAKYRFWQSKAGDAALAVGGGYSEVLARDAYGYVVGTKAFPWRSQRSPILASLGVRYDRFDVGQVSSLPDNSNRFSAFGGLEVPLDSDGRWRAIGEIQSRNNDYRHSFFSDVRSGDAKFPYTLGVRYLHPDDRFSATAGVHRYGYPGLTNQSGLFAQVGYAFGGAEEKQVVVEQAVQKYWDVSIAAPDDVVLCMPQGQNELAYDPGLPSIKDGWAPYSWSAERGDGREWKAPYGPGRTTIQWLATDSTGVTVYDTSNVTVVKLDIIGAPRVRREIPWNQSTLSIPVSDLVQTRSSQTGPIDLTLLQIGGVRDTNGTLTIDAGEPGSASSYLLNWTARQTVDGKVCTQTWTQTVEVARSPAPIVDLVTFDAATCADDDDFASVNIKPAQSVPANIPVTGRRSDGKALTAPYPAGVTTINWTANAYGRTFTRDSKVTVLKLELARPENLKFMIGWDEKAKSYDVGVPVATSIPAGAATPVVTGTLATGANLPAGRYDYPPGLSIIKWTATQTVDGHTCTATMYQRVEIVVRPLEVLCPPNATGWECEGSRARIDLQQPVAKDGRPLKIVNVVRSDDADGMRGLTWKSDYPIGTTSVKWYVVDAGDPTAKFTSALQRSR
jgi:hypothetical protein